MRDIKCKQIRLLNRTQECHIVLSNEEKPVTVAKDLRLRSDTFLPTSDIHTGQVCKLVFRMSRGKPHPNSTGRKRLETVFENAYGKRLT